MKVGEEIEW